MIHWRIVLEPLTKKESAGQIARKICEQVGGSSIGPVERYTKFEDAWSFYMTTEIDANTFEKAVLSLNRLSSSIAQPWEQTFYEEDRQYGLIFNRRESSRYSIQMFNAIRWMCADLE